MEQYNRWVEQYNGWVEKYNGWVEQYNGWVDQYNGWVEQYNGWVDNCTTSYIINLGIVHEHPGIQNSNIWSKISWHFNLFSNNSAVEDPESQK